MARMPRVEFKGAVYHVVCPRNLGKDEHEQDNKKNPTLNAKLRTVPGIRACLRHPRSLGIFRGYSCIAPEPPQQIAALDDRLDRYPIAYQVRPRTALADPTMFV